MPGVRRVHSALLAFVVVFTTGCIGATDRAEFDEEVRRRGGGISATWVSESFALVAAELAVADPDQIELLTLSVNPSNRSVTLQGRRGDRPEFVDSVTVVEREVVDVRPMQDADELPLDEVSVALGDLPLDELETVSDAAIVALGESDGFVTRIAVNLIAGRHEVRVYVESARQTGEVVFDVDGTLIEVDA